MSVATLTWSRPKPNDGIGPVNEAVPAVIMRPRTGRRGTDREMLLKLLDAALDDLAGSSCGFWACEGPTKPKHMATCRKCWSMRDIATVRATLAARA